MKQITKKEAAEKYGICVSGPNSLNRYYLRADGSVVDDTNCVRYVPALAGKGGTARMRYPVYTVFPADPDRLPQDFNTMQKAIECAEEYEPGDYTIERTI